MTDWVLTASELDRRFGIASLAHIVSGEGGLPKVQIRTPPCEAEMYLHGAQVTAWKPSGADEVIFLSQQARFKAGLAIRGGIPICFPWFRGKADDPHAPAHGVVRTRRWELDSLASVAGDVVVSMSTDSDQDSRRWWPGEFHIVHRVSFGSTLKLELAVSNIGEASFRFEEALHTYHRVGDVRTVRIGGLDGCTYLDNTDANREKQQQGDVVITSATDRAYIDTTTAVEIVDPSLERRMHVVKQNSNTTVVWNPWSAGAQALSDLGDDEWQQMICAEASNILAASVELAPGKTHTMTATLSVEVHK